MFSFLASIEWLPAILFIAGFLLVIVEVSNPGFGIPGILGLISLTAAVILTASTPAEAVILVLLIIVILGVALSVIFYLASKGKIARRVILSDKLNKESGYVGTEDMASYDGRTGRALSTLRPSGTGLFDGAKLDVVAQGEFIEKGSDIKIVKVEGRRIIVERIGKAE